MNKFLLKPFLLVACSAVLAAGPATVRDGILADADGMSLYIFKEDLPMKSNCYENCAKVWPPFLAKGAVQSSGDYTVISRLDGKKQWAYKGQPLYRYMGDEQPGDMEGEGSAKTWYVVRVAR
jgi:predicted lipoprotein with Yx(FWY)xxD motif